MPEPPGQGTIPGALTQVHWEDWVAASRIGARHVRERVGAKPPFIIAGYSNGGALSVQYALDALTEPNLPVPDRLLLESRALQMAWPSSVYSLAHVAIPIAPDDPVYGTGADRQGGYHGLPLGSLQPRGETRLLTVSLNQLMHLRHNPFFGYVEQRVVGEIEHTTQAR